MHPQVFSMDTQVAIKGIRADRFAKMHVEFCIFLFNSSLNTVMSRSSVETRVKK